VSELREGKALDRGLVIQLAVTASALVLARQISMFWLAFVAVILAVLVGRDGLRRLWHSTVARIWRGRGRVRRRPAAGIVLADWTAVVPQFLLIVAYSVVFVAFVVWLLGGRLPDLDPN
jgi:hypothetical protein